MMNKRKNEDERRMQKGEGKQRKADGIADTRKGERERESSGRGGRKELAVEWRDKEGLRMGLKVGKPWRISAQLHPTVTAAAVSRPRIFVR